MGLPLHSRFGFRVSLARTLSLAVYCAHVLASATVSWLRQLLRGLCVGSSDSLIVKWVFVVVVPRCLMLSDLSVHSPHGEFSRV